MRAVIRFFGTTALSALVVYSATTGAGCSQDGVGAASDAGLDAGLAPGECRTSADCGPHSSTCNGSTWICTPRHYCVSVCCVNSDCATGEICGDSQCRKPACGDSSECGPNETCIAGSCKGRIPATDVASCTITPARVLVRKDVEQRVEIVARNAAGQVIPIAASHVSATWHFEQPGAVILAASDAPQAIVRGTSKPGAAPLTATIGNTTCDAAIVTTLPDAAPTERRVIVTGATGELLDGVTVVVDAAQKTTTGGIASFAETAQPVSVSVYKDGFTAVTMLGVTTNDLLVPLRAKQPVGRLTGVFTARTFDKLQDVKGTVHLAISGSSIAGNWMDWEPRQLTASDGTTTTIDLGGSTKTDAKLPEGLSLGLAENMFKDHFSVVGPPGRRAAWSLGGNVVLSDVLGVVSQASGGGDIDYGAMLSALLPVLGRLQSGAFSDLAFKAGESTQLPPDFGPTTLLRLQEKVQIPTLTAGAELDGVIVVGGVRSLTQGFVPVGLSAGVDRNLDGKIDAPMGGTDGEIALRMAPANGGVEGSPYQIVAVAANTKSLGDGKTALALSAVVQSPGPILFKDNATNTTTFPGSFLSLPSDATIDATSRTLTFGAVDGADLHRLDFGNEWVVYFPPGMTTVALPSPPDGFADQLRTRATLHSARLKLADGATYQQVLEFDGLDLDDFTSTIDAFSVREIRPAE